MILLFVGGMIVLMVRTNSGFTYPGYIIYLSALYTFYTMITVVVNVVKFRKSGSPILSAAKILNFISAMMSILGLQTAMISRFSENGDNYRKTMNAITGGFVYCIVIFVAVFMLICFETSWKERYFLYHSKRNMWNSRSQPFYLLSALWNNQWFAIRKCQLSKWSVSRIYEKR